jgi:formate/nitrite transporter FocA (FNT family)
VGIRIGFLFILGLIVLVIADADLTTVIVLYA